MISGGKCISYIISVNKTFKVILIFSIQRNGLGGPLYDRPDFFITAAIVQQICQLTFTRKPENTCFLLVLVPSVENTFKLSEMKHAIEKLVPTVRVCIY